MQDFEAFASESASVVELHRSWHRTLASHPFTRADHSLAAVQDLRRAFEDERRANDELTRGADKDRQTIDDLKTRCAAGN